MGTNRVHTAFGPGQQSSAWKQPEGPSMGRLARRVAHAHVASGGATHPHVRIPVGPPGCRWKELGTRHGRVHKLCRF
eukprot:3840421-Alexandrium_andersonii.AAC.1